MKSSKSKGEIGERIAIGELAKFGIEVIIPLGDNLPFDLVIYENNKFYKCQVKTSLQTSKDSSGSVFFSLTSSNWYSKTVKKYTKKEVDIFILCDGETIYLFKQEELSSKNGITIRKEESKNKQKKGTTTAESCIISKVRLQYVLTP